MHDAGEWDLHQSSGLGSHRYIDRRAFIGSSDARVIMGDDEAALVWLSSPSCSAC
jgi:hypothetical protein